MRPGDHAGSLAPARRAFTAATLTALAAVAAVVVVLVCTNGASGAKTFGNACELVAAAIAAVVCLRSSRSEGDEARAWRLIGSAAVLWALGAAAWLCFGLTRAHHSPFPSAADAGFLVSAILAVAGLVAFPRGGRRIGQTFVVIDTAVIAASTFMVTWATVLGPVLRHPTNRAVGRAVAVSYPVADLVVAALVLVLAVRKAVGPRLRFGLLALGMVTLAVTDSTFAARTVAGRAMIGTPLAAGWVAAWAIVALAAVAPTRDGEGTRRRLSVAQELAPYVPVAAAVVVTTFVVRGEWPGDGVFVGAAVATALAVAVRQVVVTVNYVNLASSLEAEVIAGAVELAQDRARLAEAQAIAHVGSWEVDVDTGRSRWSDELFRILGHEPASFIPSRDAFVAQVHEEDRDIVRTATGQVDDSRSIDFTYRIVRPNGDVRWLHSRGRPVAERGSLRLVGTTLDVTERKEAEARLVDQARTDPLTRLPNRIVLQDTIEQALHALDRGVGFAVLVLDLDDFKSVNDSAGHALGDALLVKTADRLRKAVRGVDTVARLGGDEFAVVLPGASLSVATAVADRIRTELAGAVLIDGRMLSARASIGVATVDEPGLDANEVLRNADVAMYESKAAGKGCYTVFKGTMHEAVVERLAVESDLRLALANQELAVHYQPIVDSATGQVDGVEALVRWDHPERGRMAPDAFIPVAEATGLIVGLGDAVLERACADVERSAKQPDTTSSSRSTSLSASWSSPRSSSASSPC